jgi:hypothetical protein
MGAAEGEGGFGFVAGFFEGLAEFEIQGGGGLGGLEVFGKKFGGGGVLAIGKAFAGLGEEIGTQWKNGGEEDEEGEGLRAKEGGTGVPPV